MTSYRTMQGQDVQQTIAETKERRKKVLEGVWQRRVQIIERLRQKMKKGE